MSRKSRPAQSPPEKAPQSSTTVSAPPARPTSHKRNVLILIVAAVAAYANSLRGDYLWLDHAEIEEANYRVVDAEDWRRVWYEPIEVYQGRRSGTPVDKGGYWRPIYALSISLDWALWGERAWLNHAKNILWHVVVVVGLYCLGVIVFGGAEFGLQAVFWSTLLFAVHPMGVHSVTWISGRKDTMCAAFMVGSLLACGFAIRGQKHFKLLAAIAALCLALAVGSKELGFLTALAATVLFWPQQQADKPPAVRFTMPWLTVISLLWLCTLFLAAYRVWVVGATTLDARYPTSSGLNNFAMSAELIWHYVLRILVPFRVELSDAWRVAHTIGPLELVAMIGFVIVAVATVLGLWKREPWAVALTLFVIWLLPATGLMPLRHFHAYRYLYPASWALLTAATLLLLPLLIRWTTVHAARVATAAFATLAVCYGLITVNENRYWTDDISLFTHAVAQDANHAEGLIELSRLSLEREDNEAAVRYGLRAVDQMNDPAYVAYGVPYFAHFFLGVGLMRTGHPSEAVDQFKEALINNPKVARGYIYMGLAASQAGDRRAASEYFFKGLELDPLSGEHGGIVAHEFLQWGQPQVAVNLLRDYVAAHPDDLENAATYGMALMMAKKLDEAEEIFVRLTNAEPRNVTHRARLAWCQWQLGKQAEARANYELASREAPNDPMVLELKRTMESSPPAAAPQ